MRKMRKLILYMIFSILLVTIIYAQTEPAKIDISIDTLSIKPEGNVTFRVMTYDKDNNFVLGDANVKITDPNDNIFYEKTVRTGENIIFFVERNSSFGYWTVEASSKSLMTKTLFSVEERQEADFSIIGDKLIVTNVGNVPYERTILITIGDNTEPRQMNIEINGFVEFRLLAPEGLYKVSVTDGDKTLSVDSIALIGNIVGVVGLSGKKNIFTAYPLVWLFFIIIVGMLILILIERVFKRGMLIKTIVSPVAEFKKKPEMKTLGRAIEAEHTTSMQGTKQEAALVAVNLKNINSVKNSLILEDIERAFKPITENKGLVYKTSGYVIGIFTPQITKTFKNTDTAVKVAESVMDALVKYNQNHSFKAEVGIGVHTGEIIVDNQGKFTSLGNTLTLAKKLSDISNQEIILSKEIRARLGTEYKVEKRFVQGINIYVLTRVYDRGEHKKFVQGFLKRNFE